MSYNPPNPRFFDSPVPWSQQMAFILEKYGDVGIITEPNQWKGWGDYVVNLPGVAILSPPNPAVFTDWREWAQRFVEVLS